MISIVLQHFGADGEAVISLRNGMLWVNDEEGKGIRFGFDNLVRFVAAAKLADREAVSYTHFNKISQADSIFRYFISDKVNLPLSQPGLPSMGL